MSCMLSVVTVQLTKISFFLLHKRAGVARGSRVCLSGIDCRAGVFLAISIKHEFLFSFCLLGR